MKSILAFILMSFSILALSTGCSKTEGEGGRASIQGKVWLQELASSNGAVIREYYAAEERVYIVYGDDDFYGDEIRTHHDGTFRFDYLTKGSYQVYAYKFCANCPSKVEPEIVEVEITENDQQIVLEDIIVQKD